MVRVLDNDGRLLEVGDVAQLEAFAHLHVVVVALVLREEPRPLLLEISCCIHIRKGETCGGREGDIILILELVFLSKQYQLKY